MHKDRIETIVHLNTVFANLTEGQATGTSCTLSMPASIVSNGRQSRIVVPSNSRTIKSRKDASLIKLIAKAWDARRRLESSDDVIKMLAREAWHEADYFARLVRLGNLAPDIIMAVLEGHQPATLTRQKLARISRLPNNWNEQRIALGFAPIN